MKQTYQLKPVETQESWLAAAATNHYRRRRSIHHHHHHHHYDHPYDHFILFACVCSKRLSLTSQDVQLCESPLQSESCEEDWEGQDQDHSNQRSSAIKFATWEEGEKPGQTDMNRAG